MRGISPKTCSRKAQRANKQSHHEPPFVKNPSLSDMMSEHVTYSYKHAPLRPAPYHNVITRLEASAAASQRPLVGRPCLAVPTRCGGAEAVPRGSGRLQSRAPPVGGSRLSAEDAARSAHRGSTCHTTFTCTCACVKTYTRIKH